MPTPVVPGVYIDEVPHLPPGIAGLPTAITLFIGNVTGGPRDVAMRVTSRVEYAASFAASDDLAQSIGHYFDNGGAVAWILAPTLPADAGPGSTAFHDALSTCFAADGPVDAIDRFDLLCVPGESDPATQASLQARCAARRVFYIADCAQDATAASLRAGPDPMLLGHDARCSAIYAPWIVPTGAGKAFPPSGFVAGLYARIDAARGVWRAPAGSEATLTGASALAIPVDAQLADTMNAAHIDGLRVLPNGSIVVWGARTLAIGDPDDRYVSVRRLMLFIESSVTAGLAWTVFEPNGEGTWARVRASVSNFLFTLWRDGAFTGAKPEDAFLVRCDRNTMTQADIDAGRVIVEIGIAPLRPAEFVVVRIAFCTTC